MCSGNLGLIKITEKENREKELELVTQRLDKVEKAVRQTDEDLIKKLELILIKKRFEPMASSSPVIRQLLPPIGAEVGRRRR